MSTYYKLLCDDHKEQINAASRTAGGFSPMDDYLHCFIVKHNGCTLRVVSEHDPTEEYFNCKYFLWNSDVKKVPCRVMDDVRVCDMLEMEDK